MSFCGAVFVGLFLLMSHYFILPESQHVAESYVPADSGPQYSLSPDPIYGPLPFPEGVQVTNAAKGQQTDLTLLNVTQPVKVPDGEDGLVTNSANIYLEEKIDIIGTAGPAIEKIIVTYKPFFGEEDEYELKKFRPGDGEWKYAAGVALGNLRPGINKYTIRGYYTFRGRSYFVERSINLLSTLEALRKVRSEEGELIVQWMPEPAPISVRTFFRERDLLRAMEKYVIQARGSLPQAGVDALAQMYKVGSVLSGLYAGSPVYLYMQDSCLPYGEHCGGRSDISYFLERSDRSLVLLKEVSSGKAPPFIAFYDEHATLNFGLPKAIAVPNANHMVYLGAHGKVHSTTQDEKAISLIDGRTMTFSENACLVLRGNDGLTREYHFDFSIVDPKPGVPGSSRDDVFAITWQDGSRNKGRYRALLKGCENTTACADVVGFHGFAAAVTGHTDAGDEVYEIPAEGRELRTPIPYMERILPNYNWKKVVFAGDPENFYAEHPVIFIKDLADTNNLSWRNTLSPADSFYANGNSTLNVVPLPSVLSG
jgi:hypothetical protein